MIVDRKRQILLLEGKKYTISDILSSDVSKMETPTKELFVFLQSWFDSSTYIIVHTSGSTGKPKVFFADKEKMIQSACLTCDFLKLKKGDAALLCMNMKYIGAMMVVVRSLVCELNLVVRRPSGHPLSHISEPLKFASMVPLQVYNTLHVEKEKACLEKTEILIIGGAAIDNSLEHEISLLPGEVYSTYGMTETLSHIALRRLNGPLASMHYRPFDSIGLSLSSDDNTLIIDAPLICDKILYTNDIAMIYPDKSFVILGRRDNTINSGGIKIQPEVDEKLLQAIISVPFAITSIQDDRLGESVVLLVENMLNSDITRLYARMKDLLPLYHVPKKIVVIDELPHTLNGKIDRKACRSYVMKR